MQREMFKPPELKLKPVGGATEPRLWFRRLVIWSAPEAIPIQDIAFSPGLNIVWSPDPADLGEHDKGRVPTGPGHGAGKTLVCRLLRYCLGETHFADELLYQSVSGAFKEGRVGAEIIVDGVVWAVVRSIGVFGHDVVLQGASLETAASRATPSTGMGPFVEMLGNRLLTRDVANLLDEEPARAWLLALAWLTRDQECHFGKAMEWRQGGLYSGSPARRLSADDVNNVVRALLGAITPTEYQLETEIESLERQRGDEARAIERRRWVLDRSLKKIVRAIELEGQSLPDGPLLGEFLRNAARDRVARIAIVDAAGEIATAADLESEYEAARQEVRRIEMEISRAEAARSTADAVAKQISSETPGLTASLDEAEMPTCPVCEVPIDRGLAEGCNLSHKLPDLSSLRERRERNKRELRAKQTEKKAAEALIKRLEADLEVATTKQGKANQDVRAARQLRDERTEAWYGARRIRDDIGDIEKLLKESEEGESALFGIDAALKHRREAAAAERNQHAQVFDRLGEHFDPLVRRLLGDHEETRGRVKLDGHGLQLVVDYGGERSTPAIDLVKVLAFDLATLCRSIEGETKLPALLIHDSPRTSDLGLSIYHELFHLMRELETVGSSPRFQYIVTTTSRPPEDLASDQRVRLKLNGSPAEARLLKRDL